MLSTLFGVLLGVTSLFLILLVLVQRGRGGGLTGALGGMGGQSAFGAKAGDVFTKITVWTTFVWILLNIAGGKMTGTTATPLAPGLGSSVSPPVEGAMGTAPETDDETSTDTNPILPGGTAPDGTPPGGTSPDGALPEASPAPTGTPSTPAGETTPTAPPSGDDQN